MHKDIQFVAGIYIHSSVQMFQTKIFVRYYIGTFRKKIASIFLDSLLILPLYLLLIKRNTFFEIFHTSYFRKQFKTDLGDASNQLNGPTSFAFDNDGNLYVSDSVNHRIQKLILLGNSPCSPTSSGTLNTPLSSSVILEN